MITRVVSYAKTNDNGVIDLQRKLFKRWELNYGLATCNADGILFDTDEKFTASLQMDWPDWATATLPAELFQNLSQKSYYKTSFNYYRCTKVDELFLLVATALDYLQELTNREFEIAYEFSAGKSYTEIASALNISPSTVRNHLTRVYEKLNVDNKAKLMRIFN